LLSLLSQCPANATVCQTNLWTNITTPKDYYVLGADNFTLLLSHSFQSTIKGQSGTSSNDMKGTLTAINNTVIKQFYGSAKVLLPFVLLWCVCSNECV
jgi:hypothetical protein